MPISFLLDVRVSANTLSKKWVGICICSTYPILVTTPNFQNVQIQLVPRWKFVAYK